MDQDACNVRFVPKADITRCSNFIVIRSFGRRGQAAEALLQDRVPYGFQMERWKRFIDKTSSLMRCNNCAL
jgi:hypothetical protein